MMNPGVAIDCETELQSYAAEVFTGDGVAISLLRLQIARIAPHFRTALITGERGTGKERVAREMHRLSPAADGPFTSDDVASFTRSTSAVPLNGLIFLHGLERLEPDLQLDLAQRLKSVQRETRLLFASQSDLRSMLATGRLRQELSSRVGSLELRVPPLRERTDDFDLIAAAFLSRSGYGSSLSPVAAQLLRQHTWPGNLLELEEALSPFAYINRNIEVDDLPPLIPQTEIDDTNVRLEGVMQRHVFGVLQRCSGNKLRAAELLGISRSTLYRMLEAPLT